MLECYGAEVTAVASATEALAALERSRPDVLLFGDLAMRGESVYDLMREVTARACPLPVASISAWRLEERERELAAGFRLHLAKPMEIEALRRGGRGPRRPARKAVAPVRVARRRPDAGIVNSSATLQSFPPAAQISPPLTAPPRPLPGGRCPPAWPCAAGIRPQAPGLDPLVPPAP